MNNLLIFLFLEGLNARKDAKSDEILRINRFFDENQIEAFLYDTFQKSSLELFESMRLYIERVIRFLLISSFLSVFFLVKGRDSFQLLRIRRESKMQAFRILRKSQQSAFSKQR